MKPSSLDLMCEKALRALDPSALEHVKLYNGAIPEYILTMIVNYQHWESFVHAYQYENNREDLLKTAASRDWPPAVRHAVALSPLSVLDAAVPVTARHGSIESLRLLADHGANLEEAVLSAAFGQRQDVMNFLLAKGVAQKAWEKYKPHCLGRGTYLPHTLSLDLIYGNKIWPALEFLQQSVERFALNTAVQKFEENKAQPTKKM